MAKLVFGVGINDKNTLLENTVKILKNTYFGEVFSPVAIVLFIKEGNLPMLVARLVITSKATVTSMSGVEPKLVLINKISN